MTGRPGDMRAVGVGSVGEAWHLFGDASHDVFTGRAQRLLEGGGVDIRPTTLAQATAAGNVPTRDHFSGCWTTAKKEVPPSK